MAICVTWKRVCVFAGGAACDGDSAGGGYSRVRGGQAA
jgi:hypothetical protein